MDVAVAAFAGLGVANFGWALAFEISVADADSAD